MTIPFPAEILGHYVGMGSTLTICESDGELLATAPETPIGHEPRLVPEGGAWQIRGGPFDGMPIDFDEDSLVAGGVFRLAKVGTLPEPEPGTGLRAPPDPAPDPRYADAWASAQELDGGVLELGELETAGFVQWLMAQDVVIFHGSNDRAIDEFQPLRTSVELHDAGGRGNLGAVYGTHDGLWSLFFAVVDRPRLEGSIRNGVDRYTTPDGDIADVYHFSVSSTSLPARPFTDGALYLLPRDSFERAPFFPGGPPSPEWVSHEPVRPIARLLVSPEDFPFLDQVGGHDDGPLIELQTLMGRVLGGAVAAAPVDGGIRFTTEAAEETVTRWADLASEFFPDVQRRIEPSDAGLVVTVTGPPAVQHTLAEQLSHLLGEGS